MTATGVPNQFLIDTAESLGFVFSMRKPPSFRLRPITGHPNFDERHRLRNQYTGRAVGALNDHGFYAFMKKVFDVYPDASFHSIVGDFYSITELNAYMRGKGYELP